jgi:UDP:flavonoid glycosyltransferase YjiC (YdhE family)
VGRKPVAEELLLPATSAASDDIHTRGIARDGIDVRSGGLICFSGVGGTMGDVRPLIALALAVRARGFDVCVVGNVSYERLALGAGLQPSEWYSYSEVPQSFWLRTTAGQRWLWGDRRRFRDRALRREIRQHKKERLDAFMRMIGGPNNPRIVAAVGGIGGHAMVCRFGPQCAKIVATVMPYQPSKQFTLQPPDLSALERLFVQVQEFATPAERARLFSEETYHLVSVSPAVFPRPTDWLPNMQVTGFTAIDDSRLAWSPSPRLAEFLAAGSPPVYVGFGSYPFLFGARGERLAQTLIEGCRRRGVRCILHSSDLPPSFNATDVFVVDGHVSHRYILPRCAAVVHHGGYGTLHATLEARRPMVIYPVQTDQFLWATRMGDLGVSPGFTARLRALSAARLADDLEVVLTERCRTNAQRVGAAMRNDDGLAVQAAAVESIVAHTRLGRRPLEWRMPDLSAARPSPVPLETSTTLTAVH